MRLKIIAGNLAVVLLVGLAPYLMISRDLRTELTGRLDARLAHDSELFERSYRLSAREFTDLVLERAGTDPTRAIFSGLDESSRRTRAYDVAESIHAWLADPARGGRGAPDIVVIADETGKALARNGARNVMFGKPLLSEMPALRSVLKTGEPAHDVWLEDQQQKVLQTAIAPITGGGGNPLGALIVGYDLSNGMAAREASLLGREVAFIVSDKVYSASTGGAATRALNKVLFGEFKAGTQDVLSGRAAHSGPWLAQLGDDEFIGLTARLPLSSAVPTAFAVMGNRSEAASLASTANVALWIMLLGALMVIAYGFTVGGYIMRPIERIEDGVLAVINGRTDLRLDTDSPELGGLAYRINQLLNVFTGTEEAASEEEEGGAARPSSAKAGQAWQDGELEEAVAVPPGRPTAPPPSQARSSVTPPGIEDVVDDEVLASRLAAEPDSQYEARIYGEYVAAKQALGESVSNIPQDRFSKRLAGRASALADKHGCRLVRFQVQTAGNQVVLRPVLIR